MHSFYASAVPSGENQAVLAQEQALRKAGHQVHLVAAHTDELAVSRLYPIRTATRVTTGYGHSPLTQLADVRPDVVHVHNLFPNFGRSWVRRWKGAVVATLHNFRPLCAGGTLYRNGAVCTSCLDGDRWAGLRHGCYRGSRVASAPLAWSSRGGAAADPLLRRADRVVLLSESSRQIYLRAGLRPERCALIPNFSPATGGSYPAQDSWPADADPARHSPVPMSRWVFAGRLTPEKGLLELLRIWPEHERLDVIGDGPLMKECQRVAPQVRFLGPLDHGELIRRLPQWLGLVFPSRCLEGSPMIYPEALAAGVPILAFAGSSAAEAVRQQGTGLVATWDEPISDVLAHAARVFPRLRGHCRDIFARLYTEQAWISQIERVYAQALAERPPVFG
ncbi:glycosyltransferase family 4 protein [Streptomyces sp. MK7]|uniref:glycosyltransferase family 4 protein n=1 Tax=Streptomyces sp. MK7 TaxID=3067635 RepID=UPI00292F0B60|nr:glycosyltransferase family 4 protein [Streptomyces sp. MK7]